MSEMGKAMMGTGEASGDRRAIEAAEAAISNPLLDDVSMRGARGLLISISGGPDLTLYEVDEAATRIREEVDPDANIILGATFDDSLEGTMRVSVVATGLAAEVMSGDIAEDRAETADEPARQVYGYTGKQFETVKIVHPAPMAARIKVAAPAAVAEIEEEHYEAEQAPIQQTRATPRIPAINEFPAIAQKQIAAQQNRIESIAEHAVKKKPGIFERLATVGLGRREEAPPRITTARAEPSMTSPRQAPPRQAPPPVETYVAEEKSFEDDQLAIPAFLRRQANG